MQQQSTAPRNPDASVHAKERLALLRRLYIYPATRSVWCASKQIFVWLAHEFGDPGLCLGCVYLGVLITVLVSPAVLLLFVPAGRDDLRVSPLAAIPISIYLWNRRAYPEWRAMHADRLGARMLRAIGTGLTIGAC